MAGSKANLYTCLWLLYLMTSCYAVEPHCSKFPYEEALLEKLVRLEFKVEQMDSGIRAVQDNVLEELNKLKKEREDHMAFRKQLEEEMREDSKNLAIAQNRSLDKLQELADASNILFRARNVSSLSPSKGQTMIFTNVMTNQGSGYNSTNGIFTAPIAGLYLFSTQFCSYKNKYFHFVFYVDGNKEQPTAISSTKYTCITSVMLIELRKSSEVSVKCNYAGDRLFIEAHRSMIFSGVLIRPIKND